MTETKYEVVTKYKVMRLTEDGLIKEVNYINGNKPFCTFGYFSKEEAYQAIVANDIHSMNLVIIENVSLHLVYDE